MPPGGGSLFLVEQMQLVNDMHDHIIESSIA